MNIQLLKSAEKQFLDLYPKGFHDAHFSDLEKKYKMQKHSQFALENFSLEKFKNTEEIIESAIKLISQSAMVSVFEKAKYKDFMRSLPAKEQKIFTAGLKQMLHETEQEGGFLKITQILGEGKLDKWPLVSCIPAYHKPDFEVFMKPTTVKGIIEKLSLENLVYNAKPSWDFYNEYRKQINQMKKKVNKNLSTSNAAFSGFLMMTLLEEMRK